MLAGLILITLIGAPSGDVSSLSADNSGARTRPVTARQTPSDADLRIEYDGPLPLTQLPIVVVSKDCPTREEKTVVALWEDRRVSMTVTNDTGVARSFDLFKDVGEFLGRVFDVAYEHKSGDAVVVCFDEDGKVLRYRVFDGVSVEKSKSLALPVALRVGYIALRGRPKTDEIVLMVSGVASDGKMQLHANEWNGDKWAGWQVISSDLERDESPKRQPEWSAPPTNRSPDSRKR